ncbi:MAG: S1/P1 nuclease [Bacteroidota bacterium]
MLSEKETQPIKILAHHIDAIQQPLHVGNSEDRVGNDVKVDWFSEKSNRHRVWDSNMIDSKQCRYTELAEIVTNVLKKKRRAMAGGYDPDWAHESRC